jgi:hypothetical protein
VVRAPKKKSIPFPKLEKKDYSIFTPSVLKQKKSIPNSNDMLPSNEYAQITYVI